jgi:hypothetical protein
VPALLPVEAALVLEPVAEVPLPVLVETPAPAEGAALEAPETPAADELGEAAAEVRGVELLEAAAPVPKLTEPTANCTLRGGAGITPLRTCEAKPEPVEVLVELVPLTLAPAEGATLLVEPVPPTLAPGEALLVVLVPAEAPVPVDVLPDVSPLLAFAMQAALLVPAPVTPPLVAPGAVELTADGRVEAPLTAPVLAGAEAATLVRGAPLAAVLGAPVLGTELLALPPHAASTSEAAASVGKRGLNIMDRFLRLAWQRQARCWS